MKKILLKAINLRKLSVLSHLLDSIFTLDLDSYHFVSTDIGSVPWRRPTQDRHQHYLLHQRWPWIWQSPHSSKQHHSLNSWQHHQELHVFLNFSVQDQWLLQSGLSVSLPIWRFWVLIMAGGGLFLLRSYLLSINLKQVSLEVNLSLFTEAPKIDTKVCCLRLNKHIMG